MVALALSSVVVAEADAAALTEHWMCSGQIGSHHYVVNLEIAQSELTFGVKNYTILRNDDRAVAATMDTYGAVSVMLLDRGILVFATSKEEFADLASKETCTRQ
jgi:hypothetical protein